MYRDSDKSSHDKTGNDFENHGFVVPVMLDMSILCAICDGAGDRIAATRQEWHLELKFCGEAFALSDGNRMVLIGTIGVFAEQILPEPVTNVKTDNRLLNIDMGDALNTEDDIFPAVNQCKL